MRPTTLAPAAVLGPRHPHGTRIRYMGGCRCLICWAANSNYETERAALRREGMSNRIVSAVRARAYLLRLSGAGVGLRTVTRLSGIGKTTIRAIHRGRQRCCREETIRAIMGVPLSAVAPHSHIDAAPTWRRIDLLLAAGWTKAAIGRAIGQRNGALQIRRQRCTKRTADRIAVLGRLP